MPLLTPCLSRIARTPAHRTKWPRVPYRCYASLAGNPLWFQLLRAEMLRRDVTYLVEDITAHPGHRLSNTLSGFLPETWCRPPTYKQPILPIGHYLTWFNPALASDRLLPDGTDMLHSPGEPWLRRMWAGGSVQLKPDMYFHKRRGFKLDTAMACAERIKDVRLRGKDDDEKIFVTIERRFARLDQLYESHRKAHGDSEKSNGINVQRYFKQQLCDEEEWGDAMFKDERNLVFLKERKPAELDAIKAGQTAAVRYLDSPGKPDFSHTLTPSRSLLFRYSALTFNAHLIHLDRDYARNVEGHRNLLVHGPLSLTFILQAIAGHLNTETQGVQVFHSIEYRNLAPLYCDEEMRLCGKEKKTLSDGSIFDVWIEGPTGGIAVKGTVRTWKRQLYKPTSAATSATENVKSTQTPSSKITNLLRIVYVEDKKAGENYQPVEGKLPGVEQQSTDDGSSEKAQSTTSVRHAPPPVRAPTSNQPRTRPLETSEFNTRDFEEARLHTWQLAHMQEPQLKKVERGRKAQAGGSVRDTVRRVTSTVYRPQASRRAPKSGMLRPLKSDGPTPEPGQSAQALQTESMSSAPPSTLDAETVDVSLSVDASPQMSSAESSVSHSRLPSRANRRNQPTRTRSHQFITLPEPLSSIRRVNAPPDAVKPTMSSRSLHIMRRRARLPLAKISFKPLPIVREYGAEPYKPDAARTASRHSTFKREGARKFGQLRIRTVDQSLEVSKWKPTARERL